MQASPQSGRGELKMRFSRVFRADDGTRTHDLLHVYPAGREAEIVRALRDAHPYEEPAFDLYPLL